ncbi:MAG: DUF2269 family protein [Actinomycetota bacterium]
MYQAWKILHILGALGFVGAHGATAAAGLRIRRERDPIRIRALLELSRSTRPAMYVSLLLIVVSGIVTGVEGHWWGQAWIWWSTGLLIVLVAVAFPLAVPYYRRIRRAVEVTASGKHSSADELARLVRSSRPIWILIVESVGIAVIVALMVLKPA